MNKITVEQYNAAKAIVDAYENQKSVEVDGLFMNRPIWQLDLPIRVYNALKTYEKTTSGTTLQEMIDNGLTAKSFLKLKNAGPQSLYELEKLMYKNGVSLPLK